MLLDYAFEPVPDPLQVDGEASFTLVVSNPGRQAVTCSAIVVSLPVGAAAKDLIAGADGIETHAPPGWNVTQEGGAFTLTPASGDGAIGPAGIAFIFTAMRVNGQPGTAAIGVDEKAAVGGGPMQQHLTVVAVAKFPAGFALSDLTADPERVTAPGDTRLMWMGADDPAFSYLLEYEPSNDGNLVRVPVDPVGPFHATNLTRSGSVTFTLIATIALPGLDVPLKVPRQVTVTVDALSVAVRVEPPEVPPNGLVRLSWQASNAAGCRLGDGTTAPASGEKFYLVQRDRAFTVTAFDDLGNEIQQQAHVTVDPTIVANDPGHTVIGDRGDAGRRGSQWQEFYGPDLNSMLGGDGGRGRDATLSLSLPPLDPVGRRRVIPITVIGGQGGAGGPGGDSSTGYSQIGPGGNGGRGGDAALFFTLDKKGDGTAQYVITVRGGAGGDPGKPAVGPQLDGSADPPVPQSGQPGSASINLNGEPLTIC